LPVFLYDSLPPSIPIQPPAVGSKMCSLRIRAACGHFHIRGPVSSAARQARISAVANSEIKLRFYDSIPIGTDRTWQSRVYFCSVGWDPSKETNSEVAKWSTKRHKWFFFHVVVKRVKYWFRSLFGTQLSYIRLLRALLNKQQVHICTSWSKVHFKLCYSPHHPLKIPSN